MWKAVRNGETGGYAYLAWMHHTGHIGGHLPPHLQPAIPPGGHRGDDPQAPSYNKNQPPWDGPKTEDDMREIAVLMWGEETLRRTDAGAGVADDDEGAAAAARREWGEGRLLRVGEDVWGGEESDESWPWDMIGGGVSGAIAAADLYIMGFRVSGCVTL